MKILLDENFPLGLARELQADGLAVDHIITLGIRGASDARIRELLSDAKLIFLTQDDDFLSGEGVAAIIVVSRVRHPRARKRASDLERPVRPPRFSDHNTIHLLASWWAGAEGRHEILVDRC